jgi:hypothetical protein
MKPHLPKYPTCIITKGMYLETLMRSTERTEVSTMPKLMPLGGWTGPNSKFQNSQGCYNLQKFGIGCWLLVVEKFFEVNGVANAQRVPLVALTFRGVVAAWWQCLKQRRRQQGKSKISSWGQLLKKMLDYFVPKIYTMDRQEQN